MGWWSFTRWAIDALTSPRADVAASDGAFLALTRDSLSGAGLFRLSRVVRDAWTHSRARIAVEWMRGDLTPASGTARFAIRGWIAAGAGVTAAVLNAVKPVPVAPLTFLLPAIAIIAGLVTLVAASPLARASADRRARKNT